MNKKGIGKPSGTVMFVGIVLVMIVLAGIIMWKPQIVSDITDKAEETVRSGKSATLYVDYKLGDWGKVLTQSNVYPVVTVLKGNSIIVDDTGMNSTTRVTTRDTGTIYSTGTSYLFEPADFEVKSESYTLDPFIQTYQRATATDLELKIYDNEGNELPRNERTYSATNGATYDYNGTSTGAGGTATYKGKLTINASDRTLPVGVITTGWCGAEIDSFTVTSGISATLSFQSQSIGVTEVNLPSGNMSDVSFNVNDTTNGSTACYYKRAYIPSDREYILMNEWDYIEWQMLFDGDDNTGSTKDGDTYHFVCVFDYGWEKNSAGQIEGGWYKNDGGKSPDSIGVDENILVSGYNGRRNCAIIEAR